MKWIAVIIITAVLIGCAKQALPDTPVKQEPTIQQPPQEQPPAIPESSAVQDTASEITQVDDLETDVDEDVDALADDLDNLDW